ncbi:MAG TPA: methyltransferase domain-containing protein [Anaerolineales bacterium]
MALTVEHWRQRFTLQAEWTRDLRNHIYDRIDISSIKSILDVGCGTGALLAELSNLGQGRVLGLDLNLEFLHFALQNNPGIDLVHADAHCVPFPGSGFDLTLCHFLLLWVKRPAEVLKEMMRVTHPGGSVVAFAEPDYGGRIDHPPEFSILGEWQHRSLQRQGADPRMGRQLMSLFTRAGLKDVETGVLGGQWKARSQDAERFSEWRMIADDLNGLLPEETINVFRQLEEDAWGRNERVLFVPTFYAIGRVVK